MSANCSISRLNLLGMASVAALVVAMNAPGTASAQTVSGASRVLTPSIYASASAAVAAAAVAPETTGSDTTIENVVVTAERRSTSLEKTPVAISAVSATFLDKSFVNTISGLNAIVPSLEITQTDGSENLVSIRGVGSETPENTGTTTPGVSEFIDGVYIVNSVSLDETLFDIDHIEVLRGPQGDLFGESSIGGAINIVTKQPELNVFGGSGDFSFGDYNLTRERAELNVPVTDTVAVRVSLQKYDHDGFTKDTYFPDFREDDAHDVSGKASVLWKPISNFSATLTGQWYHANEHGQSQKNIDDPDAATRDIYQDYPSKFKLTNQLFHLNLNWELPWVTVRSVTGYQHEHFIDQYDSSRGAFSVFQFYDDTAAYNTTTTSYTQQIDFQSPKGSLFDWDFGAFVLNEESRGLIAEFEGFTATPNPETNPGILVVQPNIETNPPSNLDYGNAGHVTRQGYAGFGRATYHILPKLSVTVGARINHDSYTDGSFNFSAFGTSQVSRGYNDTIPTGRLEADYDVTSDNLVYASITRGYKPGGLNGKYGQAVVPEVFKDETNTSFEVGSKNNFLDHALRLNVAAYYYFYKNMQYIEYDPVPFDSGISNIPSIHEYGVEAEASYVSPDHHLHLDGSLAIENGFAEGGYQTINSTIATAIENVNPNCIYGGKYYNPACYAAVEAVAENIGGKTPPDMPKVSGAFSASYDFDIPTGTLTPRVQYVYRGTEWARIFNVKGLDSVGSYGVTNLNLLYAPTASRVRLSIAATNVFNVDGVNSRYVDPYGTAQTSEQYIPPRQVIATIAYAF